MAKLGFIGTGHMADAMVRHLAPKGHEIVVTDRGARIAQGLTSDFAAVRRASPTEVIDASDTVFLCLRPEAAEAALNGLPFRTDQHVISVMAGISCRTLMNWCAPAKRITMMLPMELIRYGKCPIVAWPEAATIAALFGPENSVILVEDESDLTACFAATTLVSAIAETLDVGTAWLGARIGQNSAQLFMGQLVVGMLEIHEERTARFAQLRDSLATPGTLNMAMVERLRRMGLPEVLRTTLSELEGPAKDASDGAK